MSHKIIKPDLDLVFARFAIFGMLAILFAVLSTNGLPSWFLWLVLLCGVFSIFETAIKADEVLEGAVNTQTVLDNLTKRVIIQHRIIKYQDQSINQLIDRKHKEIGELKSSIQGGQGRITELERLNQVKAQTILNLHEEIKELKASHHGEIIGHEVHLKQVKKNRDDLEKKMEQIKWLVNHQHKIITQHDQSLERMLEFKKQIKDLVLSLRNEYNLWANEEIPQIEVQLDHLENLIEANSQKCKCTDLPKAQKFFNKLIICHQCGKEHLM
ncbi:MULTISPECIES: hypothetical protein [Acinetobacter]|jgi:chromosome segregation ATPase|uniref:hypothetical protein n=1 Tax=Acinetobacter TaxID=469 RepID=UPI00226E11C8|nr:hypothetical protein [Acinetobacter baumannii]MCY0272920.1 hypothetical protein [Acinetobacter baumannii]